MRGGRPARSKRESMQWNGSNIKTNFDYPPIPIRSFDYSSWLEGHEDEGMLTGRGPTRGDAVTDLLQQLCEGF